MLLSLQPRGEASRAMLWFSPLLAALLTLLSGALQLFCQTIIALTGENSRGRYTTRPLS